MSNVDQFESLFRAAAKEVYRPHDVDLESALLVTDLDAAGAAGFEARVRSFLGAAGSRGLRDWKVVGSDDFETTQDLLRLVEEHAPQLVCTYRCLKSSGWRYPHSLGEHLDVLTQRAAPPVLVLPHPRAEDGRMEDTNRVMVLTDHLAEDHRIVDWAVRMTAENGTLWLAHVEDRRTFVRYMHVISRIPSIDTDDARDKLAARILKEPRDWIESCRAALKASGAPLHVEPLVKFGLHLPEYVATVEAQDIDLVVLNTKDDDQLAMHGLAYALAVEMRLVPLLLL